MDQSIINFILIGISSVLGWFAREMWAAVKDLKSDLAKLREEIPKQYISKDDYKDDIRELKEMLTKLFDKLDTKSDKP